MIYQKKISNRDWLYFIHYKWMEPQFILSCTVSVVSLLYCHLMSRSFSAWVECWASIAADGCHSNPHAHVLPGIPTQTPALLTLSSFSIFFLSLCFSIFLSLFPLPPSPSLSLSYCFYSIFFKSLHSMSFCS